MNLIKKFLPANLEYINFEKGRRGKSPKYIVIHIVGEPGRTERSAYSHFLNPNSNVSSHFLTCTDGTIMQYVQENDMAYANGIVWKPKHEGIRNLYLQGININAVAFSVEHEGSEWSDITEAQYLATAELLKELSRKYVIPLTPEYVIPHFFVRSDKTCPGKINIAKLLRLANEPTKNPAVITYEPPKKQVVQDPPWLQMLKERLGFHA